MEDLQRWIGLEESKGRTIINGVDSARFKPADEHLTRALRKENAIADGQLVVGILGRFGEFKRHDRLLDAFESLDGRVGGRPIHLLVVGDGGPQREQILKRMEQSRLQQQITWAGFQQDPVPWIQVMNLLVIPSENEGLSNAMLEAMACGVPCLAHSACGANEVIEDFRNGWIRSMETSNEIAEALDEILASGEKLETVGRIAREDVEGRFSLARMVENYESLYRDVSVS